jgi:hypothetical protein
MLPHPLLRRRHSRSVASLISVVGLIAAVGCAGHHQINTAPPHPIAVQVNNNLTVPTELTVYIAQDQGGQRQMLGTVPGAQTKTFNYTPASWGQRYRLIAERQLAGPIRSPGFTVDDPQTGTITWALAPNQVQFLNAGQ